MKRFLKFIFLSTILFLYKGEVKAQSAAHLTIQTLINYPDTAYYGLMVQPTIIVTNTGNAPFQGVINIGLSRDSNSFQYLYSNSNVVILVPGDTVSFTGGPAGSTSYTFDSSFYRVGNNVVVVWPVTTAFVAVDTLHTSVYFTINMIQGVQEKEGIEGLVFYPNPVRDYIKLYAPRTLLEYVRIMDLSGRLILSKDIGQENETRIPLEAIQPGVYLLEVDGANNTRTFLRFVKVND